MTITSNNFISTIPFYSPYRITLQNRHICENFFNVVILLHIGANSFYCCAGKKYIKTYSMETR